MCVCRQSVIDDIELEHIQSFAILIKKRVAAGQYAAAMESWGQTFKLLETYSNNIDAYNFLVFHPQHAYREKRSLLANGKYICMQ